MKVLRVLLVLWLCLNYGCRDSEKNETRGVTIATAANMQYAMKALMEEFRAKTGIPCEVVTGSSGKLTAQITEGAPFDIFVAANRMYPEEVARRGLAAQPPAVYAYGSLVLWTLNHEDLLSLDSLQSESVTHIAMANPKTAPYGQAALEVLTRFDLQQSLEPKFVYGESVAQTNQFVLSGAAELGFTALSVVVSPQMQGKGHWKLIEKNLYSPIEQAVVLLAPGGETSEEAEHFYRFLLSAESGIILEKFGYSVSE